jgi:hypothetical protein
MQKLYTFRGYSSILSASKERRFMHVSIHIHATTGPDFSTSDPATIDAIRTLGPEPRHIIPSHDLAALLKHCGRKHWASVLEHEEAAHCVTVVFG